MQGHSLRIVFVCLSLLSCKTVRPVSGELHALAIDCHAPVSLKDYLTPQISCTADSLYASSEEARKRDLSAWIPCNDVEWIDDSADFLGPPAATEAESLERSTYHRIFHDWLGSADRFTPEMSALVFQNLSEPLPFNRDNPILDSAMARTVKELIQGAEHNIVMDMFLLGGSWGADILHDLAAAAERGVDVILLHDNVSKFAVAHEMDPLWQAAQRFSLQHPRFLALDSDIHPPKRVSSAPFGLEKIAPLLSGLLDSKVASEGKSDHSKILIVDALYQKTVDEYQELKPRAMIGSRNFVDSAGSFYHDEAVVIRGPAALAALLHYETDLAWAASQARRAKRLNGDDARLLQSVSARLEALRRAPPLVKGQGWVAVQPIQVSANDEIRNLDTGIIPAIMAAEHSIDIYGRLAYNWPLAIALKEAMARGVRVRIILDQQYSEGALANAVLPYMMVRAPRRLADGSQSQELLDENGQLIQETDLPIKWFLPFRPGFNFASKDRSDLAQELHAKTLIIDSRLALFGSANLDSLSWAGGFREYSVWVDDPALASESARLFDRLWQHPYLTVSHKVWMGAAEPAPETVQSYAVKIKASRCDERSELCQPEKILQGGKGFPARGPKRELMQTILSTEAERIRLLTPARVLQDTKGRPQCRPR